MTNQDCEFIEEHAVKCKKCPEPGYERQDFYGFSTGYWCDYCYENNYPYKRGAYYDYFEAGEYLDDDY